MAASRSLSRAVAAGRPSSDPACAGCPQLVTLRALRRAGVEVAGALGCEVEEDVPFPAGPGRRAAMAGLARLRREGAGGLLSAARASGAALVVVADRVPAIRRAEVEADLAGVASRVARVDPADPRGAEDRVRDALEAPGTVLLSLFPCVRGVPPSPPLAVDASRCNRCGACLTLACPALSDPGGESVAVDPAVCTGCGSCAALCRSRALAPVPG
jgi:NAD-dependent dihydropyrimidine dehydrogenase PreA subunit